MERIIEHIERLLLQHDCVIIPEFGGFVLQTISAKHLEEDHLFTPTHKEIVFNPTLTHNDGLLIESYMLHYSSDYAKAQTLVRKEVAEMKAQLDDDLELQFGSTGLFFKEANRLIFMPAKRSDEIFNIPSYGLPVFNCLPLSTRDSFTMGSFAVAASEEKKPAVVPVEKTAGRKNNVIYHIPVSRTFLQIVAATAAAILLFLFIATPVGDVNKTSYSASFVPQEMLVKRTVDEIEMSRLLVSDDGANEVLTSGRENHPVTESELNNKTVTESGLNNRGAGSETKQPGLSDNSLTASTSTSTGSTSASTGTTKAPGGSAVSSTGTTKATNGSAGATSGTAKTSTGSAGVSGSSKSSGASPASSVKATGMKYYVIIASFKTERKAQSYLNQHKGSEAVANAGTVIRDGNVRVYSKIFSSEKDAETYKTKIRQNPNHKQAWIYVGP